MSHSHPIPTAMIANVRRAIFLNLLLSAALILLAFTPPVVLAQGFGSVSGKVTDATTGDPLPGANVVVEGTSIGVAADRDGRFILARVRAGVQTLEASFLGYEASTVQVIVEALTTVTQNFGLSTAELSPGEITVLGVRAQGQAQALSRQMNASYISSVVASDQMGRFPDPSAPEAVRRLPGVSVQRDMGEARYIQIRGGSPQFTQVTFNGEAVPPPEGDDRQVALDGVPVDILQSIEVAKAITPAMDAEAIGGAVHLQTKRAPDRRVVSVDVSGGYGTIREKPAYSGAVVFGDRFADGKLGFLASGSFTRRDFGADSFEPDFDLGDLGPSDDIMDELEVRFYSLWRSRAGATVALDYRLDPNSTLYITGIYSEMVDFEQRRKMVHDIGEGEFQSDGSFVDGAFGYNHKSRREDQQSINITAGGEHLLNTGIEIDYHGTFTRSFQDTPKDSEAFFVQEGVDFRPDFSDKENIQPNPSRSVGSGTYVFDELEPGISIAENTDWVGALNITVPYDLGGQASGEFVVGGKLRQRNAIQDVEETAWELADGAGDIVLGSDVGTLEFSNDGYNAGDYPYPSPITDQDEIDTFLDTFRSRLEGGRLVESDGEDYDLDERVLAFYAMTELDVTPRLMILPGVRYEFTDLDLLGYEWDSDTDTVTPAESENSYGHLFPMVHARYIVAPRTNLRAAFTRTLARPNFFELVPYRFRDDEDLEIGNPELEPTTAWNYDLMFEHYDRHIGIISGGAFFKQIIDPIFEFTEDNELGGDTEQKRNGESATIVGIETALHRHLSFLPAPLDGLSIFANYTFTDSEATLPGGLTAPLPGQPDHVFNAALSYERRGFSGQISANYHSDHVDDFGGDSDAASAREEDEFIGAHLQIDLSASYMVTPYIQVFGDVVNLTNERFELYMGRKDRPRQYEWYERWGRIGVRYSL